jgi:four helix bundle protein
MNRAENWVRWRRPARHFVGMPPYRGLKAWENARRLAVECSKVSRRLPRTEQPALAAELRQAGYGVVLRIAAGSTGPAADRRGSLQQAQKSLAEIDTILCIAHDLEYLPSRDFARLEAWADETGKTLYGLLRKIEASLVPSSSLPSEIPR